VTEEVAFTVAALVGRVRRVDPSNEKCFRIFRVGD